MIKKFITLTTALAIVSTLIFPSSLQAITAEDRLIEVERQLQAIADQISKYEGSKTDLEKAILENDQDELIDMVFEKHIRDRTSRFILKFKKPA